ncbi:MAG: DUF192 domain-containing protein [Actinomycetota bacterium]
MPERLVIEPSGRTIATRVSYALTLRTRVMGLMGKEVVPPGSALIFERAKQIHTFGMRCRIDVLFCDRSWRVLHLVRAMSPWRMSRFVLRSRFVVELPQDAAKDVQVGDQLRVGGQPDKRR